MDVTNPATGELVESYEEPTPSEIVEALELADESFEDWSNRSLREREELLAAAGDVLRVAAGATVVTGGEPLDGVGAHYPPTVLADAAEGCSVDAGEVFGPVAAVYRVADESDAISKADDTPFGLGAGLWTSDLDRADHIASKIDAGCLYVNELVKSDPRVPFGGVNDSGYGRERSGDGIIEFDNRTTVWLQEEPSTDVPGG